MRLTVAVCTWNRAPLLRRTLESMTALVVPEGLAWELVVVDNNCTDDTPQVLASFSGRLPLRAVTEPDPGKSHALNRAVAEASGDYILFTDDDVLVDPDWLRAYGEAFHAHPDGVVFGGPIAPWFEGDPPAWLVEAFHQVEFAYAALDLGTGPVRLDGRHGPLGANMAVRMAEHRGHRYDPRLGPRPGSGLRGEETALVQTLLAAGSAGYWVPGARVRHHVPRARQTTRFLREWYRGWGEYLARTRPRPPGRTFRGRPLWVWRAVMEGPVRYRIARTLGRPTRWVEELKQVSIAQGMFAYYGRTVEGAPGA